MARPCRVGHLSPSWPCSTTTQISKSSTSWQWTLKYLRCCTTSRTSHQGPMPSWLLQLSLITSNLSHCKRGSSTLLAYFISLSFNASQASLTLHSIRVSTYPTTIPCLSLTIFFISDWLLNHLHAAAQGRFYRAVQVSTWLAYTTSQVAFMFFYTKYWLLPTPTSQQLLLLFMAYLTDANRLVWCSRHNYLYSVGNLSMDSGLIHTACLCKAMHALC